MVAKVKAKTRTLRECIPLPRHVVISKLKHFDYFFSLHLDGDPDDSQNFMESKFDQDPSSKFYQEYPTSSICIILLRDRQMDRQAVKKILLLLVKVI